MKRILFFFFVTFTVAKSQTIIIIGDTQSPTIVDKNRFVYNNNDSVNALLYQSILNEEKKDAVIHLGDITAFADNDKEWLAFDNFYDSLQKQEVPLLPVVGNHEYMLNPTKGIANFHKRFPERKTTYSLNKIGQFAIIIVNSNFDQLSKEFVQAQDDWYRRTINDLEADTSVSFIFVCAHHPPFTNNTVTSPDKDTKEHFWDRFFESKKTVAFISGHSHAYEHFAFLPYVPDPVNRNKRFSTSLKHTFVSGGGGGIQHPLLTGDKVRYPDIADFDTEIRPFHYLRFSLSKKGLLGEVISPFNQGSVLSVFYIR